MRETDVRTDLSVSNTEAVLLPPILAPIGAINLCLLDIVASDVSPLAKISQ
jgi:hypothetical protein